MIARLRNQAGAALPTALGVLTVVGVLSASVFAVSLRLSDTSTASRDGKRALAAADAGLEAAVFRMNVLGLQNVADCFTTQAVDPGTGTDPLTGTVPASGECAGHSESLGNGARYTYYVTPGLSDGDRCAGIPVQHTDDSGQVTVNQRCVTSVGVANGEMRRVQARVASYIGTQLFPVGGILALNELLVKNGATVSGRLGSNGAISLGNNSVVSQGVEVAASAPNPSFGNGSVVTGGVTRRSPADGNFVLAPVDMGSTATENHNLRIAPGGGDIGVNATYDPTKRVLTIGNNGALTLGGGTYNFCRVVMGNNAQLTVAPGATVRFFVDSPDRENSGCIPAGMTAETARAAGYGLMSLGQNANFNNTAHAVNFQLYIYGWTNSGDEIEFNNSVLMNAAIYAPQTKITFKNSGVVTGGIAADRVEFKNTATFTWSGDNGMFNLQDLRTDTVSVYYRMAWAECRTGRTSATDPESGC